MGTYTYYNLAYEHTYFLKNISFSFKLKIPEFSYFLWKLLGII